MTDLVVIAHNIRSLHNVGSIFRTSEGAGVNKIFLTGYTGIPPRKEISKVALGSENVIAWQQFKNISSLITKLKTDGYFVIALEQDPRSVSYRDIKIPIQKKVALIVGNEVLGVSKALRDKADVIAEIPMIGSRKSLNVSVAFGIAIYSISESFNH